MAAWQKEKDAGWSWLILTASFFTQMITLGTILCFGLYFVVLRDHFACSRQEVAGIGGTAYGIFCITGKDISSLWTLTWCKQEVEHRIFHILLRRCTYACNVQTKGSPPYGVPAPKLLITMSH